VIVSLHIPKTAGTSLLVAYRAAFDDRLLEYNIDPESMLSRSREDIKSRFDIVHGHLNAAALNLVMDKDAVVVTFLRNPVQRVLSSYFFHKNPEVKNELGEQVRRQSMPLKEFADTPSQCNLQARMVQMVGLERLNFIGISEQFSKSVERLSDLISVELELPESINVSKKKPVGSAYDTSAETYEYIASRNKDDIELYKNACKDF
jgi:hypothetical protein